jgi:ASPM-SPD-2-Hydin domain-containing protein
MQLCAAMSRSCFYRVVALIAILASAPSVRAASVAASQQRLRDAGSTHLVCTPASLQFGQVAVGQTRTQLVTISNLGSSSVKLSDAITSGGGFGIRGLDFPLTLASGESFTFTSYFAPESKGDTAGNISLVADVSDGTKPVVSLRLSGTGTAAGRLTVTLSRSNLGAARVGTRIIQVGTVTAGNSAVTISSVESSSPEFVLSGLSFPVTIPAGEGRQFTVVFEPRARGAATATFSFLSNAGNSPTVQSLIGAGASDVPHSVDLSWNPISLSEIVGYNVYRGLASGGPYTKINPVLNPSNAFTDRTVDDGETYYYVATAVDFSGQESAYSNEVQAVIPPSVRRTAGTAPLHRRAGVPSESDEVVGTAPR